ncbi:MAG: hypothetical protein IT370_09360 [Deltaproteobacteria bacterium]|nr:hypothetical protein [Deltaproteobacteria bacterium]
MTTLPHSTFTRRHPTYNARRWAEHAAIAFGGGALLDDDAMLSAMLPAHLSEPETIWSHRKRSAFHVPVAGSIIEGLAGALMGSPLAVEAHGTEVDPGFYAAWPADVSRPGGRRTSLQEHTRDLVLDALVCGGIGWTLLDLPIAPALDDAPRTLAQQPPDARRPYLLRVPPACVVDWEEGADSELAWALIRSVENRRVGLTADRDHEALTYRLLTPDAWQLWRIDVSRRQRPAGPLPDDPVKLVDAGPHSFGRVPLVRLELPEAMRPMGKLYSLARAHFAQLNICARASARSMARVPIEFRAPSDPSGGQPDPQVEQFRNRQPSSPLEVSYRDAGDRLEWSGPPHEPVVVGLQVADRLEADMYRAVNQLALNADPRSAAAVGRSGLSKQVDRAAAAIVLRALGQMVRDHVLEVFELAAVGRGDVVTFAVSGCDHFDDAPAEAIEEAQALALVDIPSPTFKTEHTVKLASRVLGDVATPALMAKIRAELEGGHAADAQGPSIAEAAATAAAAAMADPTPTAPDPVWTEAERAKLRKAARNGKPGAEV